jgi:hypothetical protein
LKLYIMKFTKHLATSFVALLFISYILADNG